MGAMIQTLVSRVGTYLDFREQWHTASMDARQVFNLFQAVAKDRTGKSHATDPDLGEDLEIESWSTTAKTLSQMLGSTQSRQ